MKNLLFLLLGGALLVSPSRAQSDNDISIAEFRQSFADTLYFVDAVKGTEYSKLLTQIPDSALLRMYRGVSNGRKFQAGAAHLRTRALAYRPGVRPAGMAMAAAPVRPNANYTPLAGGSAAAINNATAPPFALATIVPPSGPNWSLMAHTLQAGNLLTSDPVTGLSAAVCTPSDVSGLTITSSTFHGIKDLADTICDIIPDILVVILGEGTTLPAKEICFAVSLIVAIPSIVVDSLLADCGTQDNLTSNPALDATYSNGLALAGLKLHLKIEANLLNTAQPIGLFELPSAGGGYLEVARAIVADTITKMVAAGQPVSTAAASLATGDGYFNAGNYKLAYRSYQKAYGLAVQ